MGGGQNDKKKEEEGAWSHMGTSKQTGVEFQQCGKQQTLHSVREETSVAGILVAAGLFPPRLTAGRRVG